MPIVLDPSKNFVAIQFMYIEEENEKHGNSTYHFIGSRADFDTWKKKGYSTVDEITQQQLDTKDTDKQKTDQPGMPLKPPIDPKKIIKILRTWWSRMTWKEQNQIYSRCIRQVPSEGGGARTELDMISYRDFKLKTCLKKWDYKDESGQDVPVSENIIDNLVPEVAQELLNNFELVTEANEEDLKN